MLQHFEHLSARERQCYHCDACYFVRDASWTMRVDSDSAVMCLIEFLSTCDPSRHRHKMAVHFPPPMPAIDSNNDSLLPLFPRPMRYLLGAVAAI